MYIETGNYTCMHETYIYIYICVWSMFRLICWPTEYLMVKQACKPMKYIVLRQAYKPMAMEYLVIID